MFPSIEYNSHNSLVFICNWHKNRAIVISMGECLGVLFTLKGTPHTRTYSTTFGGECLDVGLVYDI